MYVIRNKEGEMYVSFFILYWFRLAKNVRLNKYIANHQRILPFSFTDYFIALALRPLYAVLPS